MTFLRNGDGGTGRYNGRPGAGRQDRPRRAAKQLLRQRRGRLRPAAQPYSCFDPRARMGRDHRSGGSSETPSGFDPRARMGRDCRRASVQPHCRNVSIHAPAWGATLQRPAVFVAISMAFRSTRPHGARLPRPARYAIRRSVSIHAPAWGATVSVDPLVTVVDGFRSTRPHGARPGASSACEQLGERFDPRARMGRDADRSDGPTCYVDVSIHAPAWGATSAKLRRSRSTSDRFDPRARMGRDAARLRSRAPIRAMPFRSTRPHGARHAMCDLRVCVNHVILFRSTRPHGARRVMSTHR